MSFALALGGDDPCWLYLPLEQGRRGWSRVVDPDAPIVLQELHATSPAGDLLHPGEVPLAAATTLAELLAEIDAELGSKATVEDVRFLVAAVTFSAHRERSVRLEAAADAAFAPFLARFTGVLAERWRGLLAAIRDEALTERPLRVTPGAGETAVLAYRNQAEMAAGIGAERHRLRA